MGKLAANKGNGECISTTAPLTGAPMRIDWVLLPPFPGVIPFPAVNTAELANAVDTIPDVHINGKPVVVQPSSIPTSRGAPFLAIKGMVSQQRVNNKCELTSASATVFANGKPLIRHRDTTTQNAANCVGAVKLRDAFSLAGSGLDIDPADPEYDAILAALDDLYERPVGRGLIEEIGNVHESTGNVITIASTTGGNQVDNTFDWTDARDPGVGSSSTVLFNPTRMMTGDPRPPLIGLAHEMVHSLHIAAGTFAPSDHAVRTDGTVSGTAEFELQALGLGDHSDDPFTDNRLRDERGLPNRNSHVVPNQPDFDYAPTDGPAPVAFATGAGGENLVYAGD